MPRKKHEPTMQEAADRLVDDLYKENDCPKETNAWLRERSRQLEQLVRDYQFFVGGLSLTAIPRAKRDALQQRAEQFLSPSESEKGAT